MVFFRLSLMCVVFSLLVAIAAYSFSSDSRIDSCYDQPTGGSRKDARTNDRDRMRYFFLMYGLSFLLLVVRCFLSKPRNAAMKLAMFVLSMGFSAHFLRYQTYLKVNLPRKCICVLIYSPLPSKIVAKWIECDNCGTWKCISGHSHMYVILSTLLLLVN